MVNFQHSKQDDIKIADIKMETKIIFEPHVPYALRRASEYAEYGMGGYACIHNMARYIAVAARDVSTSLRYLDFEL